MESPKRHRIYDPRKLDKKFASRRDTILERIQALIDKGLAQTVDGERFATHLSETQVRSRLGLRLRKRVASAKT